MHAAAALLMAALSMQGVAGRTTPEPQDGQGQVAQQPEPQSAPQEKHDAEKPPTPEHTGIKALIFGYFDDLKHLPSRPNLELAATGGVGALIVHPYDQSFNAHLRSHYDSVDDFFAVGKYLGGTWEQVAMSVATYAYGRAADEPKVSHLGMDLLRAQMVSETIVEPLKFSVGRTRPDGSNNQSFPSGHAAVTFADATVLERHLGWKHAWIAYVVAGYVSMSRLHDNVHYLSDVVFGAAIGTIAGRTVTQHGRNVWTFMPATVPGGVAVVAVRQVP